MSSSGYDIFSKWNLIFPGGDRLKEPNYGLDAPGMVGGLAAAGVVGLVLGIVSSAKPDFPGASLMRIGLWPGISCFLTAGVMFWSSKVGKFWVRDRMIGALPWRGDERVLDVGCGHGLMLIGAAKRLKGGKAVGIDIWQSEDQYGNSPEAAMENARIEGVSDRIELKTADARRMPFPDGSFDVIVSSYALHNIPDKAGRRKAVAEIARVLKPGGKLALVDIFHAGEYAGALRDAGIREVRASWPFPLFFLPTRIVTASKS